jgi:diguanylate cyclase (GGDEF)-like protein/PAS domain S-box-containing protein
MDPLTPPSGSGGNPPSHLGREAARAEAFAAEEVRVVYAMRLEPDVALEYVSESVSALMGVSASVLTADPALVSKMLGADDCDVFEPLESEVLDSYADFDFHVLWQRPTGEPVWTRHRARKQRRADGVVMLYGTARGTTAQYASLVAQRTSAQQWELVALNAGQFVIQMDREGVISWASPAIERYVGRPSEQVVGHHPWDFAHPDDQAGLRSLTTGVQSPAEVGGRARIGDPSGDYRAFSFIARAADLRQRGEPAIVITMVDIHDLVEAEQALAASENHFRLLAQNSTDVVLHIRGDVVVWASPSLASTFGWEPHEWVDSRVSDFLHPDDVAVAADRRSRAERGLMVSSRTRIKSKNGTYHWVASHGAPFRESDGAIDGIVASLRIVDKEVEVEAELNRRARYDELTGLLNRREVFDRLSAILNQQPRTGKEIAVAFCDLDGLKETNDIYGHGVGDDVLRTVADRIQVVVRKDDLVARVGGDEILLVLHGVHGVAGAGRIAHKIVDRVAQPHEVNSLIITPSVSIGVTLLTRGEDLDAMIQRADRALYRAKAQGPSSVVAVPAS